MVHFPAVGAFEARKTPSPHIIDTLIAERAPRLTGSAIWPFVRPGLYSLLDYKKARRMAETICQLGGRGALDHVADLLALKVEVTGLENLPATGRCILVSNHPTGIGDGVAVYDAIKTWRPDVVFYANADAHRVCRRFDEVLIPVEWVEEKAQPRADAADPDDDPRSDGGRARPDDLPRRPPGHGGRGGPADRPALDDLGRLAGPQIRRADRADPPDRPCARTCSTCSTSAGRRCATSPSSTSC
jgi:hypothetical protein